MKIFTNSILFATALLLFSLNCYAQQPKLSEKPEDFIVDMQKLMTAEGNAAAIESDKKFEGHWNNFNADQKTKTIVLARKMLARAYKMPQFYSLFEMLDNAIEKEKLSNEALDNLLTTTQKIIDSYDLKSGTKAIETLKDFFGKRLLYASNYNRLFALGGNYSLKFLDKKGENKTTNEASKKEDKSQFDTWDAPLPAAENTQSEWTKLDIIDKKIMPILSGIGLELKAVDLVIATSSDSVVIQKTSGNVSLKDGLFVGNGGKFTWENVALPLIFVTLNDYSFELRNPKFTADDVVLSYSERLTSPIHGVFEYKSEKRSRDIAPTYPRFMSYQGDVVVKNIEATIEYKGGFAMAGKRIYSSSINKHYSVITVKKNGKIAFKAISNRFEIGDSLITASQASIAAYLEQDSISHPAVRFSYNQKLSLLKLRKIEKNGFQNTPYSDTYHRMEIKSDGMQMDLTTGKMDFYIVSAKDVVPVIFESFDFYNLDRMRDLSQGATFNPLLVANNYLKNKNKTFFSSDELAQATHIDPQFMQSAVINAVQKGFMDFDPMSDSYKISRKGTHYIAVFNKLSDYDDFRVASLYNSRDSTANATLNIQDKSLSIRGIKEFKLSDSLKITVIPNDATMKMGKSRVFTLNGQIKLGNFRFTGNDFVIDYDKFTVALNKVDSITFIPQEIYRKGGKKEIGGHIRYPKPGMLYINRPSNKSGSVNLAEYPKLVFNEGITVYFDKAQEANGPTYGKKVYFEIPKIDTDSLNVKDIEWAGTFYSENIFTPFKETLRVMPDASLGFSHQVPNNQYTIYGMASAIKFSAPLLMDAKGLHTEGNVQHLAANLTSKDIYFRTDSLMAKGQVGEIKEMTMPMNVYFPQVEIQDYTMKWLPKADSMLITSKEGFDFYTKTSKLTGKLVVRSKGLFGIGIIRRTDSEIASEQFKFNKEGLTADMAQLKVNATMANMKPVLLGNNVNINFIVAKNLMEIATNTSNFNKEITSTLEFPSAAYKTNIRRAEWQIVDKKITMKGDVKTATFTSTEPKQEGLSFNGSSAVYNIDSMRLNISGVPYIRAADAKIFPVKGEVSIRRDAEMLPFKNAHLTIDTLNGYHNLTNGNIKILSKSRFSGDATYQFVNIRKDTFNIKMGNFELREVLNDAQNNRKKEKSLTTFAQASVTERDSIFLSPKIIYRGGISMIASIKNLSLDGFVRPDLKKYPNLGGYWIPYKGNKSEEITINVDKNLISGNSQLFVGLHERAAGGGIYPTFLSAKETPEDHDLFVANGIFKRDEQNKLFSIAPEKQALEGNRYELLDEGNIKLTGTFDMLSGKIRQFVQSSGLAKIRLDTPKHEFNLMMVVNFPIQPPILAKIAEKIVKTNLDEGNSEAAIVLYSPEFQLKLAQFIGDKGLDDYKGKEARQHVSLSKESPKFIAPLVFSDLQLRWSPKRNAFYSVGKIGVSNIGETDINNRMDGYVEIIKNAATGDEMYIYLEVSENVWYYWGYKDGEMGLVSSEQAFNDLLTAKSSDKEKKTKEYAVIPVDFSEAKLFQKRFLNDYRGIKTPAKTAPTKDKKAVELAKDPKLPVKKEDKKKKEDEKEGF